jgi:hypothetical protein
MKLLHVLLVSIMLVLGLWGASRADLVSNGGFESGFTGWEVSGNFINTVNSPVHGGDFAAELGTIDPFGSLTQLLATTPGNSYDIDFWLSNAGGTDSTIPNAFNVYWDGTLISAGVDLPAFGYTNYHLEDFPAGPTPTVLQFAFYNGPGFFYLDDVSVSAVPEPSTLLLLCSGLLGLVSFRKKSIAWS